MPPPTTPTPNPSIPQKATLTPLPPFQPDLYQRAWSSIPHPTLPLLATGHAKSVTVFSLATLSKHSALTGGHARSVRTVAWQPARGGGTGGGSGGKRLGLVTGSFDATAGLWSFEGDADAAAGGGGGGLEREVRMGGGGGGGGESEEEEEVREWEFNLVLEGHENEVKSLAFSPGGQYLATSSRDKSVWIWEDVSSGQGGDDEDEWETVAVLSEHDGDVKAVAWCPSNLPNARAGVGRQHNSSEVLASASYDDTVRVWREDADGEWVSGFGGVPSTMRRSLREEWDCTAVLPKVHTRDVYSVSWSADTGLVASTGSDGIIAVYAEESAPEDVAKSGVEGGAENGTSGPKSNWKVLGTITRAHGPYEVNHITWCKRFDPGAEHKGKEEMLVTTGDDGVVRPWQVRIS
ncbi:hypothetical protein CHGG_10259 [Chaetomium globosum CBS 148.51]|uniref:uncharacterized protein n=1 Tax=Chaetomium globosum (strain ATCC 6205 / CBS 148.51 / DSM 1962 / NBRC 6347 / NRRL 1970) TaxID=306901 RepID=UPI00006AAE38|nr:uncharacterized protein CHGG_10259 [Chaetomium globosum CBS 148.51]EAQ83855.1 hypothetical protein CHGG_10259 [Chaetomium globosum CBS 148.51]